MNRFLARPRLLLLALALIVPAWMTRAGGLLADLLRGGPDRVGAAAAFQLAVLGLAGAVLLAQLPAVARNARFYLPRVFGAVELLGGLGLMLGTLDEGGRLAAVRVVGLVASSVAVAALAWLAGRGGETPLTDPPRPFFWLTRDHVADRDARHYSLLIAAFFGTLGAALYLAFAYAGDAAPGLLRPVGWGFVAGLAVMLIQFHWCRALGVVPWAWLLLTAGLVGLALRPAAGWSPAALGLAGGLAYAGLFPALLSAAPPRQRLAAVLIAQAAAGAVAAGLAFAVGGAADTFVVLAALAAAATPVAGWLLWRPFVEQLNELVFRPLWFPVGYGPGLHALPTRGPLLVIANHGAWFDPVWLAGVVPIRTRALMSSKFLDQPLLKWLAGRVYRAIRVPDDGAFRRSAPELDEAIAALREGEAVMIFPEAWLRRREEQPLRRFANGVHRILSAVPDTPVVACWIEGGWGSRWSHKDGPPGKNKPMDVLKRIHIGVSPPELLPPELLADDMATRRHLMKAVLAARAHLGLAPHPMPSAVVAEKPNEPPAAPPAQVS